MHDGPHSDASFVNFVYNPDLPGSPFDIDPAILRTIAEYGFVVEWHVREVGGKLMDRFITGRAHNRWAPVKRGNFGGVVDHLANRDGYIYRDGLMLEGLPIQIYQMAVAHRERAAREAGLLRVRRRQRFGQT